MIIYPLPGLGRVAAIGAALSLAAACATAPAAAPPPRAATSAPSHTPRSSPAPHLTLREAERIYAQYARLNREIYSVKGVGLQKTLAGLALELSRADYRLAVKEGWQPTSPPKVVDTVEMTIARVPPGRPQWFVATLKYAKAGASRTHLIFQSSSATAGITGWRVVAGATAAAGQTLPPIARDANGIAEALPEDAGGLVATPRQVAGAHARWVSNLDGTAASEKQILTADGYTSATVQSRRAERAELRGQWRYKMRTTHVGTVYGLRTRTGGALVWYALREQHIFRVAVPGAAPVEFTRRRGPRVLSSGRSFTRAVQLYAAGWFLAVVPAAGPGRRAKVTGDWYSTLSVRGS
ncbi:hypothetical protein [Streptosporangium sp. CA-115845]|uniref:hypothetical protein n=1 Tax=Streptosporangium sp. CA-115845 TaxID=3240071 RepID=UPI003D8DBB76